MLLPLLQGGLLESLVRMWIISIMKACGSPFHEFLILYTLLRLCLNISKSVNIL